MPRSTQLQAAGVRTKVGTWALSEAEAAMIELSADRDEKWEASLAGKEQWLHKPLQPPGLLRSGKASSTAGRRTGSTFTFWLASLLECSEEACSVAQIGGRRHIKSGRASIMGWHVSNLPTY